MFTSRRSVSKKVRSFLVLAAVLSAAAVAQAALVSVGDSSVRFRAGGPAGLTIEGEASGLRASEAAGVLTISVPLATASTGISMRDDHLKEALRVKAHPLAQLSIERSKLSFPADNQEAEGSCEGRFTLNGQTQAQTLTYKVRRTGSDFHVKGKLELDIERFKIERPCYLGVCVDKDVKVLVNFKLREQ